MPKRTHLYRAAAAWGMAGLLAWNAIAAGSSFQDTPKFFSDDPLWRMPAPASAKNVADRKLNEYYDFFENSLFHVGERAARAGEYLPSQAINTVDEVPDSAWYTNRHASRRMTIDELKIGTGLSNAPAAGRFTVVAAKNEGITPGFVIKDAAGRRYVMKFDPLSNPEMASAADVISSKFLYALGYNVPENHVFYFDRDQITTDDKAQIKDEKGRKRAIRATDLDEILAKVPRSADGRYRALASLFIPGRTVGPFRYHGTRGDDPNDLVAHENRRDLRALRTFCAWLGHDDSKSLNTLDTVVEESGVSFVKHYLIDFGASLGSASFEANSPRDGNAYLFGWKSAAVEFATFGLYVPKWQHAKYPNLPAVGRFEYEVFDPLKWVPEYPNAAFRNENPADRAWAARKIAAFTDDDIRAIVSTGQYSDPAAAGWVVRCLIERRNKITRAFLSGATALDGFAVRDGRLESRNLDHRPGATVLKIQWSVFENRSGAAQVLPGAVSWKIPDSRGAGYLVAHIMDDAGAAIAVYLNCKNGEAKVVGIERDFGSGRKG